MSTKVAYTAAEVCNFVGWEFPDVLSLVGCPDRGITRRNFFLHIGRKRNMGGKVSMDVEGLENMARILLQKMKQACSMQRSPVG